MKWGPQQEDALASVADWLHLGDHKAQPVFYLAGYAGTGKTTLAQHFAQGVKGTVLYGAYTGKAALVMRSKGCAGATTLHRMIYVPKEKCRLHLIELQNEILDYENKEEELTAEEQKALRKLHNAASVERENLKKPSFALNPDSVVPDASLVIIDEASFINGVMGEDLLSFGTPLLVLGDPAQLPPIKGTGYFTSGKPDVMLTEIYRQGKNSPIIDLATTVRTGGRLAQGRYGDCEILPKKAIKVEDALKFDQVLVGRHVTRKKLIRQIRAALGRTSPLPEEGDRLVCLRNNHLLGLLNGSLWTVTGIEGGDGDRIFMGLIDDTGYELGVEAHTHYFEGREEELQGWEIREAECFDFGNVLTVHKAQGSQWPRVLIIDESFVFNSSAAKWLYTGITRAAEAVTIVDYGNRYG